jgi:WD40 repeat protein
MLRPEQLADLGRFLRDHRFVVSPAQLNDAARLLIEARELPNELPALGAWLSPLLCMDAEQQGRFAGLYSRWLVACGLVPADAEARDDPDGGAIVEAPLPAPRSSARWLAAGTVALLATLVVTVAGMAVWAWQEWHERELVVHVSEDGKPLRDAAVEVGGRVIGRTDDQGLRHAPYVRHQIPLDVAAAHPTRRDAASAPLRTTRRVSEPPDRTVMLSFDSPHKKDDQPPQPSSAQPLRILSPLPDHPGPVTQVTEHELDPVRLALLVGAALAPLFGWAVEQLRRRGFLERLPADDEAAAVALRAGQAQILSSLRSELRHLGRELRRRVLVDSRELDLAATLSATVARAGMPRPVFGMRVEPEYLFLVDRAAHGDHLARLADELLRDLDAQGVHVARYRFDADLERCWHAPLDGRTHSGGPQSLAALAGRHAGARLIIVSDGRGLIGALDGMPVGALTTTRSWERPLLLTPVARARWGRRETLLQRAGLTLLPLDAEGLLLMAELLAQDPPLGGGAAGSDAPRPIYLRDVDALLDRQPPPAEILRELLDALQSDLDRDDALPEAGVCFAWLCALAVYPEVHWGITLVVGDAVTRALDPAHADDGRRRAMRLARLARLPWLRHGHLPEWFREALLERMPEAAEQSVREHLRRYLDSLSKLEERFEQAAGAEADPLHIAREPLQQQPWRDVWQGLRHLLESKTSAPAAADRVFLRFIDGRPRRTAMAIGDRLRGLLYRDGVPLAGARLLVPVAIAVTVGAFASFVPPQVERSATLAGPAAAAGIVALAFDRSGSRLAAVDDRNEVYAAEVAQGTWRPVPSTTMPPAPAVSSPPLLARAGFGVPDEALAAQAADRVTRKLGRPAVAVAVDAAGRTIAAVGDDGRLRLMRDGSDAVDEVAIAGVSGVALALSADGSLLAAALPDRQVHVWKVDSGPARRWLLSVAGEPRGVAGPSPSQRVESVQQVLDSRYGFSANYLRQPTVAVFLRELDKTLASSLPSDQIVLHFSGAIESSAGRPSTLELRAGTERLPLSELASRLAASSVRDVLVVLDSPVDALTVDAAPTTSAAPDVSHARLLLLPERGGKGTLSFDLAQRLAAAPTEVTSSSLMAGIGRRVEWRAAGHGGGEVSLAPLANRPPSVAAPPKVASSSAAAGSAPGAKMPSSAPAEFAATGSDAAGAWQEVASLVADNQKVPRVRFSRDGRLLAAVSWANTVSIWETETQRRVGKRLPSGSFALGFSPIKDVVFAQSSAGPSLQAIDANAGTSMAEFSGFMVESMSMDSIAPSPDGRTFAVGLANASSAGVAMLDANTGRTIFSVITLRNASGLANNEVAFTPDGSSVAAMTTNGELVFLDAQTGREQARANVGSKPTYGLAISPDGRFVATCDFDSHIKIWRIPSLILFADFDDGPGICNRVAIDPSGTLLVAIGFSGGEIQLRRFTSGERLQSIHLPVKGGGLTDVTFSPDGRTLAVGTDDGTVILLRRRYLVPSGAGAQTVEPTAPAASR